MQRLATKLLWCLVAVTSARCAAPCQDGTVFLQLTLAGQAQAADSIGVTLTVGDQAPEYRTVARSSAASSESLALAFPGGYPAGRPLTLTVIALRSETQLAMAVDRFTAQPTCTLRALTLRSSGADGGAPDGGGGDSGAPSIGFVQLALSEDGAPTATATAPFLNAQGRGDVNLVVIGVGDLNVPISSVSDQAGNSYAPVVGPTSASGALQTIYAAANIRAAPANANAVTVTFAAPVRFLTVVAAEYSGVSRVDGTATNTGSTGSAFSGAAPASGAPELVFAAGVPDNFASSNFTAGDPAFTVRLITGGAGMLIEDRIAASAGTYGATGALSQPAAWVMQAVTLE